ncbi:hypothetical protein TTHERM_000094318 (macronuclear) [Tetrahymena thermophila SB210]|uniref:Uncharacterized protein n=1 Tax=Tetrahymena thermophila (strain SB210) TaxID=312017 RepID=W7XCI8_TETTS|nr:hypothetical protein TTHERM_000094318 [Tetrahymena thermophila SB210]EWS75177.1 hypothetical protein TTHERM_000094318 [Tetrahymena thermophila SB210]|eukprot:XP_012652168.1 hypothetical protein TTHERM_000094318 [Tetrahymena thermophila SB210]
MLKEGEFLFYFSEICFNQFFSLIIYNKKNSSQSDSKFTQQVIRILLNDFQNRQKKYQKILQILQKNTFLDPRFQFSFYQDKLVQLEQFIKLITIYYNDWKKEETKIDNCPQNQPNNKNDYESDIKFYIREYIPMNFCHLESQNQKIQKYQFLKVQAYNFFSIQQFPLIVLFQRLD